MNCSLFLHKDNYYISGECLAFSNTILLCVQVVRECDHTQVALLILQCYDELGLKIETFLLEFEPSIIDVEKYPLWSFHQQHPNQ